jgi:hypothetical protein
VSTRWATPWHGASTSQTAAREVSGAETRSEPCLLRCQGCRGIAPTACRASHRAATGPTKVNGVNFTDFCEPSVTLSGCKCHPNWSINGTSHYGSCANTGDPRGSWCVVDRASCGGVRAHEFSAANTTQASVNGSTAALTGLDFDYWCVREPWMCMCCVCVCFPSSVGRLTMCTLPALPAAPAPSRAAKSRRAAAATAATPGSTAARATTAPAARGSAAA